MNDAMKDDIGRQVDAISKKLHEEFLQHVKDCQQVNPQMTDTDAIFKSWAIQKIAGLHGLTLSLVQRIGNLEAHNNGR